MLTSRLIQRTTLLYVTHILNAYSNALTDMQIHFLYLVPRQLVGHFDTIG